MSVNRSQLHQGMDVHAAEGASVGTVKEIRSNDFLMSRSGHPAVYVPFNAVRGVSGNTVTLNVTADEVSKIPWPTGPGS